MSKYAAVRLSVACLLLATLASLATTPDATTLQIEIPLGLIEPDIPLKSPLTVEKVALGGKLFNDPRLSISGKVSCATCHDPRYGFAEPKSISFTAKGTKTLRNTPTILNSGYLTTLNWDGKWKNLEQQIVEPFSANGDMGIDIGDVLDTIDKLPDYSQLFERAFGQNANRATLAGALAAFQRSLVSGNSRFDEFLFNGDSSALSSSEKRGYEIFIGRASCINCHDIFHPSVNNLGGKTALFTDFRFHNLGIGYSNGRMSDLGRYFVTRHADDWGAFKTPILRNVVLTAPYMHDGSLETLRDVVEFYNRGGIPNPNLAPGIRPLLLSDQEINDIVNFLGSLTDRRYEESRR